MTTIYFIRHGQINRLGGVIDPALTEHGIAEAEAAARHLAGIRINHAYASNLCRARETAEIVVRPHKLSVVEDSRLRERANFGDLPGQTVEEFVTMWERCNVERTWAPPVGDSSEGCGQRVESFVADCHARWPDGTIIAASHGGTIVDFLLNVFTRDEIAAVNSALAATPFNGGVMRECSITVVGFDRVRHVLSAAAQTDHLPANLD